MAARSSSRSTRTGCASRARVFYRVGRRRSVGRRGARVRRDRRHPGRSPAARSASGTARACAWRRPAPASSRPSACCPTLRTNKDEGQANFVNPGIFILNGAADVELTPKLRGVRRRSATCGSLKTDVARSAAVPGEGAAEHRRRLRRRRVQYRPPLSDNIVIVGGIAGDEARAGAQGHLRARSPVLDVRERAAGVLMRIADRTVLAAATLCRARSSRSVPRTAASCSATRRQPRCSRRPGLAADGPAARRRAERGLHHLPHQDRRSDDASRRAP